MAARALFLGIFLAAFSLNASAQTPEAAPTAAAPAPNTSWMNYRDPYAMQAKDMASANRTNEEIIAWGERAIAECLSFNAGAFNTAIAGDKKFFLKNGWQAYAAYMRDTKLLGVAQNDKYQINTIVDGTSMIVNSGSAEGVFRWIVRIPVITSINQPGGDGGQTALNSSRSNVEVTISRVTQGGVDGLAIESWRMATDDKKSVTK